VFKSIQKEEASFLPGDSSRLSLRRKILIQKTENGFLYGPELKGTGKILFVSGFFKRLTFLTYEKGESKEMDEPTTKLVEALKKHTDYLINQTTINLLLKAAKKIEAQSDMLDLACKAIIDDGK
jgi:hypothetical protein